MTSQLKDTLQSLEQDLLILLSKQAEDEDLDRFWFLQTLHLDKNAKEILTTKMNFRLGINLH
jgi:hypothetical protein